MELKEVANRKKLIIIAGMILILAICIMGSYYFLDKKINIKKESSKITHDYSDITYEDCVQETLERLRTFIPASEEPIGAERTDNEGNIWTKQESGDWKIKEENLYGEEICEPQGEESQSCYFTGNSGFVGTSWGDALIDEQVGGAKYTPKEFPECEKYISTRNKKMEEKFVEIVNQVIAEQNEKGIFISAKEL